MDAEIVDDVWQHSVSTLARLPVPSMPARQVAELRRAIEPYVDPRALDLVAAVAVGAAVLARQRQQRSSQAWLEAGRRRQAAGVVPVPPPSVWSWWRRGDGVR